MICDIKATTKEEKMCEEQIDGWVCTRKKDHEGLHHAHGTRNVCFHTW